MSNAFTTYRHKRDARQAKRANARRIAKLGAFLADGLALVATIALIAALCALAGALAVDSERYALVVGDDNGNAWVIDYDMTYDDCRNERATYALGVAQCEAAKG